MGQPGISFRYLRTFGVAEQPYFDDPDHLNGPNGIGTDGAFVWIAECEGRRALKFGRDGTYQTQLGRAGFREGMGTTTDCPMDVAVDGEGNTWVVDSADHLVQFDPDGNILAELGQPWGGGSGNDRVSWPHSVAFDSAGNLYVSDTGNHRVQVFDANLNYLTTLGETGVPGLDNNHFSEPHYLSVDANDRLYVADTGNQRVQIFDVSSLPVVVYLGTLGVPGESGGDNAHFNTPEGVAADPIQGRIYVGDAYNWRVQLFDYSSLAYQMTLSGFSYVADVAVDAAGYLYVAEPWTRPTQVRQFDPSLVYVRTYGTEGVPYLTDGYRYFSPAGVAVGTDGSVLIAESNGRRLLKLSAAGVLQWTMGEPGIWGGDNHHFSYVEDVDLGPLGRAYAVDPANHRVQIYSQNGIYQATLGGSWGTGEYEFNRPQGVALAPNGTIYVADSNNHRVQVYDSNQMYLDTLGEAGVSGSDNGHFDYPVDVDVDAAGTLYVVDHNNHRVQVFDASRAYVRTIGESGVAGEDFGHLRSPTSVTVDGQGRTYVADIWGGRIQVFDASGAYLTTIGWDWGSGTGGLRDANGLTTDTAGNLYVADNENHRVQVFAPGVAGWVQSNLNGFGTAWDDASDLAVFGGQLVAGGDGLWRTADGRQWTEIEPNGLTSDDWIESFAVLSDTLYLGTYNWPQGARIYRSSDAVHWTNIVTAGLGITESYDIIHMTAYSDTLYAGVLNTATGGEIWRSTDGLTWTRVMTGNFGSGWTSWWTFEEFEGHLYAGLAGEAGMLYRTTDGETWTLVTADGFGDPDNAAITALAAFGGNLYAGTRNMVDGAQVWASADGTNWNKVADGGFAEPTNRRGYALHVAGGHLYFLITNTDRGDQVWRTSDGLNWDHVGVDGWGDDQNIYFAYSDRGIIEFQDHLYLAGTGNAGVKVWKETVTADFEANPTRGAPPLTVGFVNRSSGDYVSSLWDFGDSSTATTTDPAHVYDDAGVYTVKLTVNDGQDTSTVTRTQLIRALYPVYLPLTMRNAGLQLYDNFSNPAFDGSFNPALWEFQGDNGFLAQQQAGCMAFTSSPSSASGGANLLMLDPGWRSLRELHHFEAQLKINSDHTGGYAFAKIQITSGDIAEHGWWTQCRLGSGVGGGVPFFTCDVVTDDDGALEFEYVSPSTPVEYDRWYTVRIEANPTIAELRFTLDGALVGSHIPSDAATLIIVDNLQPQVGVWNDANTAATRYVDDVRITPTQP